MRQVSKEEFFLAIGQGNVHPEQVGQYPYTSVFRNQANREEVGRIVPVDPSAPLPTYKFMLPFPICDACGKPMDERDRQLFEENGAGPNEWPCCHAQCAEDELARERY